MSGLSRPLETPVPLFERSRAGAKTYWNCRIGRRIRLARAEAKEDASHEKLAQRLDLSPWRLWEIESGLLGVDAAEIALIAEVLGVHPGYFFDPGPWSDWRCGGGKRPGWLLAKTIGEMDDDPRAVLENLVLYLAARQARRHA